MKKFTFALVALFALSVFSTAQAGVVRFGGDVDPNANPAGGVIQVIMDLDAQDSFLNGGVVLGVAATTPGVIQFDDAAIVGGSWALSSAAVSNANRVDMSTSSVITGGLTQGGQGQVFATINYSVLDASLSTGLEFVVGPEALVDGRNFGTDVTPNYEFQPGSLTFIPEPSTIALAGLSLVGLVLRRRNG